MTDPLDNEAEHLQLDQINSLIAAAGVDGTREIMDAFWRSTTDLLATLTSQLNDNAYGLAAGTAHAIKGSAANVGAMRLAQTAALVEDACKSGAGEDAAKLLTSAHADFEAVRSRFDDHLANA